MGFIWFLLGGVLGGAAGTAFGTALGAGVTAQVGVYGLGAAMRKLNDLPEPCRSMVAEALGSLSEEDFFNEYVRQSGISPMQADKLRQQLHPSSIPLVVRMEQMRQQAAAQHAAAQHAAAQHAAAQHAAGALWMHHGYYDPNWPYRVYPYGYGG